MEQTIFFYKGNRTNIIQNINDNKKLGFYENQKLLYIIITLVEDQKTNNYMLYTYTINGIPTPAKVQNTKDNIISFENKETTNYYFENKYKSYNYNDINNIKPSQDIYELKLYANGLEVSDNNFIHVYKYNTNIDNVNPSVEIALLKNGLQININNYESNIDIIIKDSNDNKINDMFTIIKK